MPLHVVIVIMNTTPNNLPARHGFLKTSALVGAALGALAPGEL